MKVFQITLAVIFAAALVNFVRNGASFHIARTLPLCGGFSPGIYDIGAAVLVLFLIWGLARLKRRGDGPTDSQ